MVFTRLIKIELEESIITILIKKAEKPIEKMSKLNLLHIRFFIRQIPNKKANNHPPESNKFVITK